MSDSTSSAEDIFKDRRSSNNSGPFNLDQCRRSRSFGKADARPWWLKVNYVSQDFITAGTTAVQKILK